jgi:protein involved in sex pheromone biosynthesis
MTIRRFELEALRMNDLYKKGVIKLADLSVEEVDELREIRDGLMDVANRSYKTKKKTLHLLDKGEAAALALAKIMKDKNGKDVPIAIDERTARMLVENPENLRKVLEKKFHTSVTADLKGLESFKGFKVIRSTEIVYMAFKKRLTKVRGPKALEALLYGLRFKGASISDEEIVDYVGMK